MGYISPEIVGELKRMDLLTYLRRFEPGELVHVSGDTYATRTHDSLKISNGMWMWWSRGIGGKSALDYLIKVQNHSFLEAINILMGGDYKVHDEEVVNQPVSKKDFILPGAHVNNQRAVAYLEKRGIEKEIITECILNRQIYESDIYHNIVFIGMDEKGVPSYGALRGINSDYIGEVRGSDKSYSFAIPAAQESDTVHLFESAIDLLSYATIEHLQGNDWKTEHLLSLAGVYQPAKAMEKSKVPVALQRYLKEHPRVKKVVFHLDNDIAGRKASQAIRLVLPEKYVCDDAPPKKGKDYNDYLCSIKGKPITKREKKQKNQERSV